MQHGTSLVQAWKRGLAPIHRVEIGRTEICPKLVFCQCIGIDDSKVSSSVQRVAQGVADVN